MKNLKIISVIILLFAFSTNFNAQFSGWLNKKKDEMSQKVNDKINQKASQAMDKAVDAPEKVLENKKNKKNKKSNDTSGTSGPDSSASTSATTPSGNSETIQVENEIPNENGQTIIQTNIKCENGKKSIINLLKKQDGVFKIDINIKNGELSMDYSSDGTPYTEIIKLINDNGFEADGNPAKTKSNICK